MGLFRALLERLRWQLALFWGALIGGAWLFAELADEIHEGDGLFFDAPILAWLHAQRHPLLDGLMVALSFLGDVWPMALLALLGAALVWRRRRREGVFFAFGMGGTLLLTVLAKYLLGRERPALFADPGLWMEAGPSFPSGHAAASFALFVTVLLLARRGRFALVWLSGFFALAVGASRVYLQVHYPSDVLASWALAAAWVLGLHVLMNRDRDARTVVLTLRRDTVERYREAARAEGLSDAAFVEQALRQRLARTPYPAAEQARGKQALERD